MKASRKMVTKMGYIITYVDIHNVNYPNRELLDKFAEENGIQVEYNTVEHKGLTIRTGSTAFGLSSNHRHYFVISEPFTGFADPRLIDAFFKPIRNV